MKASNPPLGPYVGDRSSLTCNGVPGQVWYLIVSIPGLFVMKLYIISKLP